MNKKKHIVLMSVKRIVTNMKINNIVQILAMIWNYINIKKNVLINVQKDITKMKTYALKYAKMVNINQMKKMINAQKTVVKQDMNLMINNIFVVKNVLQSNNCFHQICNNV